jgi:hypothetical protein
MTIKRKSRVAAGVTPKSTVTAESNDKHRSTFAALIMMIGARTIAEKLLVWLETI